MSIHIKVNNTEYPATVNGNRTDRSWDGRDTKTIYLTMSHDAVAALLPDNTPWSIVQRDMVDVLDEQGKPTGETKEVVNEYDNSEYSLAGDITDHRDGTVSIKMGKPTETESAKATVTALAGGPVTYARAVKLRPIIEQAAVSLSDGEAASVPELITAWAYPVACAKATAGATAARCTSAVWVIPRKPTIRRTRRPISGRSSTSTTQARRQTPSPQRAAWNTSTASITSTARTARRTSASVSARPRAQDRLAVFAA